MRVGILTFHDVFNSGAFWQAYATCDVLQRMGHEPIIINYTHKAHRFRPLRRLCSLAFFRRPQSWADYCLKARAFAQSQKKLLPLSRQFLTHEALAAEHFDAVLIGADIVWDFRNPHLGQDPVYFGDSLNTSRLISWAASMGSCALEEEVPGFVRTGLAKFNALSVRDEKTAALVKQVCGKAATILPDPTFNLNLAAAPRGTTPAKPYIAVYISPGLVSPGFAAQARAFAVKTGLPLYAVGYRASWADRNFVAAAPEDWLATIEQAEYVLTNTFHGTVFSILLGKQFAMEHNIAIESKTKGMLERLGLDSRAVRSGADMAQILTTDWNRQSVCREIETLAASARTFLRQALA